jgi:hypothetical protein
MITSSSEMSSAVILGCVILVGRGAEVGDEGMIWIGAVDAGAANGTSFIFINVPATDMGVAPAGSGPLVNFKLVVSAIYINPRV